MIPTITTVVITLLLPIMLSLDNRVFQNLSKGIFVGYSAEAARLILSSICTALMTVIGVLFSITVVVIQQVSAQYSPRVVEIFIKSRNGQFVLGLYVGTFTYGILLLRQIPSLESSEGFQIPQSAISLSIILALTCISFLIQYVHYITHAIKSTNIIKSIIDEGVDYLEDYEGFKQSHTDSQEHKHLTQVYEMKASTYGYFQSYLPERIDSIIGRKNQAKVRLVTNIGEYLNPGDVIAVCESQNALSEKILEKIKKTFSIGPERTHVQDVRYSIRQLVDIALRALSPGINDPSTALEALNGVGVILNVWIKRFEHSGVFTLELGNQLIVPQLTLEIILEQAFAQIIPSAKGHYQVLEKILQILHRLKSRTQNSEDVVLINRYIENVKERFEKESKEIWIWTRK